MNQAEEEDSGDEQEMKEKNDLENAEEIDIFHEDEDEDECHEVKLCHDCKKEFQLTKKYTFTTNRPKMSTHSRRRLCRCWNHDQQGHKRQQCTPDCRFLTMTERKNRC